MDNWTRLNVLALIFLTASLAVIGIQTHAISAPSIGATIEPGSANKGCDYVVYKDGSTALASKGDGTGNKYSGTNEATIVNNAIGDLTAGRTWIETVCLKGDFTGMTARISPDSFTRLDLRRARLSAPGLSGTAIADSDATIRIVDKTDVEIIGGYLTSGEATTANCGSGDNTPSSCTQGIAIRGSKRVVIDGTYFTDFNARSIFVAQSATQKSSEIIIRNVQMDMATGYESNGITVFGTDNIIIANNRLNMIEDIITLRSDNWVGLASGLHGITKVIVIGNNLQSSATAGAGVNFAFDVGPSIMVDEALIVGNYFSGQLEAVKLQSGATTPEKGVARLIITGNIINSVANNFGIELGMSGGFANDVIISGNTFDDIGRGCIRINTRLESFGVLTIQGNVFRQCNQNNNASPDGTFITLSRSAGTQTLNRILISDNIFETNAGSFNEPWIVNAATAAVDTLLIVHNQIRQTGSSGFFTTIGATNVQIRYNQGYATENQGATSVADGGTVSHGLAATPTSVQCTTSIASQFCSVTALAATTFTVAIKTDTGAIGTTQTIYWWAVAW